MNNTIYVDVLLIVNFVVNYFLILGVGRLMSLNISRFRIIMGAIVGALASLAIFIDNSNLILLWLVRVSFPFLIIMISYPFRSFKNYIINTFSLFAVSMIFSGAMLGIWIFVPIQNMNYYNGIVYFNINPTVLFLLTIFCYFILTLLKRAFSNKEPNKIYYKVHITRNEKTIILDGFIDTGNRLKEPFTDIPVAVCSYNLIKPLLTDEEYQKITDEKNKYNCPIGFRIIPYNVLQSSGIMIGFMPDELVLKRDNKKYIVDEIFIGLTQSDFKGNDFNIILPADLFLEEKEKLSQTYINYKNI
ncbi:MAG: sigma-E processing peptidase SpoIIGA [Oscillospiraceae bacterium]